MECDVEALVAEARRLARLAEERPEAGAELEPVLEKLRECVVVTNFLGDVTEARLWIRLFESMAREASAAVGARGVLLPKELRSFIRDPLRHLVKKLFNYAYELARGKVELRDFMRTAEAAVRTSIRSNMRSLYEGWVFLALVRGLAGRRPARIVFPEHAHILLERSGRQRGGGIPPNLVLRLEGRGYVSLYLEAPRPIGWGDSGDLAAAWKLYVALRPDMMAYGGRVIDIVRVGEDPPIERPDVIIECKELEDWYARVREVRGPLARPMTAEEWRSRWIRGLWSGLADILGFDSAEKAYEEVRKRRGVRLTEPQIVQLYAKLYQPRRGVYLVSRKPVPRDVARRLEDAGVTVIDDVGFNWTRLKPLVEELEGIASFRGVEGEELLPVPAELAAEIEEAASRAGATREELLRALLELARRRWDELLQLLGEAQRG